MRGWPDVRVDKDRLRRRIATRRSKLRPLDLQEAAVALRGVLLSVAEVNRSAVVAVYVSVGTEPGTGPLLESLACRGVRVLLPVLRRDADIDWGVYTGPDSLASAPLGLLEPVGRRLGVDAVASADAVLVPGLAADRTGMRLGRGGGSYDRVLSRIARDAFSCILLHDGELLDEVLPSEPHDRRIDAAATPSGLVRFPL